ncbi:MAG TPA: hypothetical protein VEV38_01790, partial [Candidatus Eremiobacteraceae bacterium]|nr:hypothetical protein [Candidatus Eremiobacteraceae bacterium]
SPGDVQFLDGNLTVTVNKNGSPINYSGLEIVNGCMVVQGATQLQGGATGEFIVLGTDDQCGGYAFSISGNANWNSGTLYAANGSVSISGTGNTKYVIFYGDIIAASNVNISGNGNFVWQSGTVTDQVSLGQYSEDSFMQY